MSTEALQTTAPATSGRRHGAPTITELGLPEKPLRVKPKAPPAAHLRAKLDAQLRALLDRDPGTRSGVDPEDLHQMRVAVRRMRSVLKLSGGLLGSAAENVRAELGWLGGVLGEVRDQDVLIGHLRETVAGFGPEDRDAGERLVKIFVTERGKSRRKLTRALGSARYHTLLQSIAQLCRAPEREITAVPDRPEESTVDDHLVTALRKPYRKLGKAVGALPGDPPDDELHALRIRGKRLRYAAELARTSAKKKQDKHLRSLIKATRRLQDVLGDHQDAVVAADRMRALLDDTTDVEIGFVAGRIAEQEFAKRARARAEWPKAMAAIDTAAGQLA